MNEFDIKDLAPGSHIHMIGIGGISMSAIAHMLLSLGFNVSGSDRTKTNLTDKLEALGVTVYEGQKADNIKSPNLVCYTAAIAKDDPELVCAIEKGIPCLERAELLGQLMTMYRYPLAIAGTHGKTTTTSMLSLIILAANLDPTILVGGELPQIDGNYRIGSRDYLVCEACEYVESFLNFRPFLSIITNIEADHLDYFGNLSNIITSFGKFARLNSPLGHIIVCSDDKNTGTVVQNIETSVKKYAINDKSADFVATCIKVNENRGSSFEILYEGEPFISVDMQVAGQHNVLNALAATAAAHCLGIDKSAIKEGLESFTGTKRRFEKLGEVQGFTVIDDYAHHPTEIEATLKTAKSQGYNNVWCIFQPHTYSRTYNLFNEFVEVLPLADKLIVADVYSAREKYDGKVHSCDLAAAIDKAVYMNDFGAIERYIRQNAKPGDLVMTVGAGDVFKIGKALVQNKEK